jgi:4-carboxymuconolactone decarboxylase
MARLPSPQRDALSPAQQRVYDLIKETRGNVRGPFAIWLNVPELAEPCLRMQHALNYHSRLDKRLMQLMTLIMARRASAQFAWFIHARHAHELGIENEIVEAIRTNQKPPFIRDDERLVYDIVVELDATRTLSETSYARALSVFGTETLVELVTATGFYAMVAMTLNAFDAPVPGGERPLGQA